TQCKNQVKQMALACINFESGQGAFPPGRQIPDWVRSSGVPATSYTNYNSVRAGVDRSTGFYSVHVRILPYMEEGNIYDLIDFSVAQPLAMAPRLAQPNYEAYDNAANLFICPSEPNAVRITSENSYRTNFGGSTIYGGASAHTRQTDFDAMLDGFSCRGNGAFTIAKSTRGLKPGAYTDGLSKTAFIAERLMGSGETDAASGLGGSGIPTESDIITSPNRQAGMVATDSVFNACANYTPAASEFNFFGTGRWLPSSNFSNGWPFAGYANTQYNHVAPPNWEGQDCGTYSSVAETPGEHAIVSARSAHSGVVVVGFGDGHTEPIADDIDLVVWRAMGSRNGEEVVDY
ncbi:MAG: DUF1559 domain-containing protein, partial [Planctomycetota bacterium]